MYRKSVTFHLTFADINTHLRTHTPPLIHTYIILKKILPHTRAHTPTLINTYTDSHRYSVCMNEQKDNVLGPFLCSFRFAIRRDLASI